METKGSITLPNGQTIGAGQGGCLGIGSDRYPVTIVGWTKSGKTIYYQGANSRRVDDNGLSEDQSHTFSPDPGAEVETATWRTGARHGGEFVPKGRQHGYISTRGHVAHRDPSF